MGATFTIGQAVVMFPSIPGIVTALPGADGRYTVTTANGTEHAVKACALLPAE